MQTLDTNELENLINEYLLVCEVEGKSPFTLRNYRQSLHRFLEFARNSEITNARFITLNFLAGLNRLKPSTRNTYFRQTKALFSWALEMKLIDSNPFDGLKNVRIPDSIKQPFTRNDIRRMLDATSGDSDRAVRDTAIIMCFVDTGLRVGELVGIDLEDVDFDSGRIIVRNAKGGHDRVVPFASRCSRALQKYLTVRSRVPGPLFWKSTPTGELMPNTALARSGVRSALGRVAEIAEVEGVYPHRFRHSFATWAIKNNARELDIQHLLGHRSPDMVRWYTRTYKSEQAAERHRRFSPGDRLFEGAAEASNSDILSSELID